MTLQVGGGHGVVIQVERVYINAALIFEEDKGNKTGIIPYEDMSLLEKHKLRTHA